MRIKPLILFTVFIDILGLSIIIPVLPFYVEQFSASALAVTLLFSVYALCSFVSAPILGVLSDRFGRRPILIGSIISTAVGWFVFASGASLFVLYLGRIIDGLAAGNISTAQSYLSDISSTPQERTANLGLIGAMFGIGFTVGPLIGGVLGSVSTALPFWAAGVMASVNALLALRFLPETHKLPEHPHKLRVTDFNPLAPLVRSWQQTHLRIIFMAWFCFTLAFSMQQSVFALYMAGQFGYSELIIGTFFTASGVVIALNQIVLMKRFWLARFSERTLGVWTFVLLGTGLIISAIPLVGLFVVGLLIGAFGQATLRPVITSLVSGIDAKKRGENLGTMTAVMSLGMVVGPALAGLLFNYHLSLPFVFGGLAALLGAGLMYLVIHSLYVTIPVLPD